MTTPTTPPRWYCVNNTGLATLCASQRDAETTAADSDRDWPKGAPHQSVLLGDVQALTAERDRLAVENSAMRARLDRAVNAAEQHFGEDAIRYKISLFQNGRARNVFPPELDGRWVAFQRADNDAHIGLCDRINTLTAEVEALRVALRFYGTGEHYHLDPDEDWDSVSGEPENWLCSDREGSTTMIENGTVARMVLQGKAIDWSADGEDCTPSIVPDEAPAVAAPHQAVLLGDVQALTVVAQNTVTLLEYLLREGLARRKYGPAHRVLTQAREALGVPAATKDHTT